jgi:hypothetical protein
LIDDKLILFGFSQKNWFKFSSVRVQALNRMRDVIDWKNEENIFLEKKHKHPKK